MSQASRSAQGIKASHGHWGTCLSGRPLGPWQVVFQARHTEGSLSRGTGVAVTSRSWPWFCVSVHLLAAIGVFITATIAVVQLSGQGLTEIVATSSTADARASITAPLPSIPIIPTSSDGATGVGRSDGVIAMVFPAIGGCWLQIVWFVWAGPTGLGRWTGRPIGGGDDGS